MKKLLVVAFLLVASTMVFAQSNLKLKVGATPVPHAEILGFIKDDLKKQGIDLEIVEFTDYVTPNLALSDKQLDANFFQHLPYLETFNRERKLALVSLAGIHIEPMGLYSRKISNIKDLKDGALIAIPNDPTNEGRALLLLQEKGLITLNLKGNALEATVKSIKSNPKKLKFRELDAAQLPRVLQDVDGAIINGNYAIDAKLSPVKDALIIEGAKSPYVNIVAVRRGTNDDPRLQALVKALQSEKVKQFIIKEYKGGVIPTF